jgi:hypothetical protein
MLLKIRLMETRDVIVLGGDDAAPWKLRNQLRAFLVRKDSWTQQWVEYTEDLHREGDR